MHGGDQGRVLLSLLMEVPTMHGGDQGKVLLSLLMWAVAL